jgi:GNAT superfamily N-acetyltransferase
VIVRPATPADAAAIADLLGQLGYPTDVGAVPLRMARMAENGGQTTLVAEVDGRVVGMTTLHVRYAINSDAPMGRLVSVVVDSEHRSRGVGQALIREAERVARDAGCDRVEVTSAAERGGAHRFYERLGYEVRSKRFIKTL